MEPLFNAMAKNRYHFFRLEQHSIGKSFLTIPGQTLGKESIHPGILVKDYKGKTVIARAKRNARVGEIFFTTTLARANACYKAKDIYPLDSHEQVLFSDAYDAYASLSEKKDNESGSSDV